MDSGTAQYNLAIEEGIALVEMNRPPVNAMSSGLRHALAALFAQLDTREDVRAVVLTGAGKTFCGGMDVKERSTSPRLESDSDHRAFTNAMRESRKPYIAALNGPAVGTGVNIAAACDVIIAAEGAFMSMPEVKVGVPNGASGLVRLFGQSRGRRMFFTGMRVPAEELYRLGVVEACVAREQLIPQARAIAREMAEVDPSVLAAAKQMYNLAQEVPFAIAKNLEYAVATMLPRPARGGGSATGGGRA